MLVFGYVAQAHLRNTGVNSKHKDHKTEVRQVINECTSEMKDFWSVPDLTGPKSTSIIPSSFNNYLKIPLFEDYKDIKLCIDIQQQNKIYLHPYKIWLPVKITHFSHSQETVQI